jgi:hypothetical protein
LQTHLPGYVSGYQKFKDAGAEVIACLATNDPFVMSSWGERQGANGKVRMLSDMNAEATKVSTQADPLECVFLMMNVVWYTDAISPPSRCALQVMGAEMDAMGLTRSRR